MSCINLEIRFQAALQLDKTLLLTSALDVATQELFRLDRWDDQQWLVRTEIAGSVSATPDVRIISDVLRESSSELHVRSARPLVLW